MATPKKLLGMLTKALAKPAAYVSAHRGQIASAVRTAQVAIENPEQVVAGLVRSLGKRAGMPIEHEHAKMVGQIVVRAAARRR